MLQSSGPVEISEHFRDQDSFGEEVGHVQGISTNVSCELVSSMCVVWASEHGVVDVLCCIHACGLRAFRSG